MVLCVTMLAFQLPAIEAQAMPVPDTSFGTNGMTRMGVPAPAEDFATVAALQSDEKLLIAGSTGSRAFVLGLNANGALDSTFGNGGFVSRLCKTSRASKFRVLSPFQTL